MIRSKGKNMNLVLHIGMQRTGTTFLQYNVFPYIKEINMVDFDRTDTGVVGNGQIKKIMLNIEKYDYDIISKKIFSRFKQNKINLISDENINCKMFSREDKRFLKTTKLKEFFPDAKIIFGIRNKEQLFVSWYVKYVMKGGSSSFREYINEVENVKKLDYEPYIDFLYDLYGKENVYVYKFEDLKNDAIGFVRGVCDFIGVVVPSFKNEKSNVAYNINQLKIALFLNRFLRIPLRGSLRNATGFFSYYIPYHLIYHRRFFHNLPGKKVTMDDLAKL